MAFNLDTLDNLDSFSTGRSDEMVEAFLSGSDVDDILVTIDGEADEAFWDSLEDLEADEDEGLDYGA